MPLSIKTENLRRIYKPKGKSRFGLPSFGKAKEETKPPLVALDGVTLEVEQGELFGLLGPNGAGKTTLIKILTTLLAPSSGTALVEGFDVMTQTQDVRRRINMVSGGETSGYGVLTVRENLWMFSQLYGVPSKEAYRRADELLEKVELSDKAHERVSGLSTGQRQRMNFCRGFITDPNVLFLDEPTLGLDVNAARVVRKFSKDWIQRQPEKTMLLTTHYMAEADELCDRIAIIDHGMVLACDTPQNLKLLLQKQPIFRISVGGMTDGGLQKLRDVPGVVKLVSESIEGGTSRALDTILESEAVLAPLVSMLTESGGALISLEKHEPTLEDVFVKLVGRSLKEAASDE